MNLAVAKRLHGFWSIRDGVRRAKHATGWSWHVDAAKHAVLGTRLGTCAGGVAKIMIVAMRPSILENRREAHDCDEPPGLAIKGQAYF
jgi:hypothetical protein